MHMYGASRHIIAGYCIQVVLDPKMRENLVDLFTELSREIIKNEFRIGNDFFENKQSIFNTYVGKLRTKCFDILLGKYPKSDYRDPCKTSYGADWDPVILILDYGGGLAYYGGELANKMLITSVETLKGKDFSCLKELFEFIFLLHGFLSNKDLQHDFLHSVSEYNFKSSGQENNSDLNRTVVLASRSLCTKESLGVFESGCHLINSLCNKSIKLTGKVSKKYLNSRSSSWLVDGSRHSSSSSDFSLKMKLDNSSSFLLIASNAYSSGHLLWDNFVEKPLSYKLRRTTSSSEKTNYPVNGSEEKIMEAFQYSQDDYETLSVNLDYWTNASSIEEMSKYKNNEITAKQVEDTCLYPISKETSLVTHNYESCFGRNNLSSKKLGEDNKNSFFQSSATLILALWEQEHRLKYAYDTGLDFGLSELRILELQQYLKDVQFLLMGVQTETFQLDKNKLSFDMVEGTCVEGVTPSTLRHFSKEFLEIGEYYIKLSHHTHMNLKKQMISDLKDCRVIFKVFWISVYDYLCQHSHYVLKIPLNLGLLEFKNTVKNLHPVIRAVAELCNVSAPYNLLPQGGQLLSYLLRATQRVTNKYVAEVFFGILKSCCEVYLLQLLQDWMFQGHLDRHHRDFFVEHRPKNSKCKDRSYYLSFYMFHERIPSFLKGLEEAIFNCGKTIHLLKLIQPESTLCKFLEVRAYPKMKLCLSDTELFAQRRTFDDYAQNILKLSGKFTSILSLRQDEMSREALYERYIVQVKKEQEIKRQLSKEESLKELREKRDKQNRWLNEQIRLAAIDKSQRKEEEERQRRLYVENIKNMAEEKKRLIEEEKLNIKLYYEELMEVMEKRRLEFVNWKHCSNQLNKSTDFPRNYKSSEAISVQPKDSNCSNLALDLILMHDTDSEGNIVIPVSLHSGSEIDLLNSNIVDTGLVLNMEDVENENVVDKLLTYLQLKNVITTREEYQNCLEAQALFSSYNFKGSKETSQEDIQNENMNFDSENNLASFKPETVTPKNKNIEYDIENEYCENISMKSIPLETEAQNINRKVIGTEYGGQLILDKNEQKVENLKSEALNNKKKVLGSEYIFETTKEPENLGFNNVIHETEAQKNKKKVMASEFAMYFEEKVATDDIPSSNILEETEAQRNKKKVMACEFGVGRESFDSAIPAYSKALSIEALKNKNKFFEVEFGCDMQATERNKQLTEKVEDTKVVMSDHQTLDNLKLNGNCRKSQFDMDFLEKFKSTFAEKSLKIYNKQKSDADGLKFFTLNESKLGHGLSHGDFPWPNYSEVQILFEQHLRKRNEYCYAEVIGNNFVNMDVTKFTNYVRKSVLDVLKIQEALANEALFNHLLKEENLLSHFKSLRNYFFLNDGEFSRRLTQNIFSTLAKCTEPCQFFKRNILNEIVYEALNYTIHNSDPNSQHVSFEIVDMPVKLNHFSHDVLSPFELCYQVKWPLNIIFTEKTLSKYKLVFHFLLKLKRIAWTLNENFSFLTYSYKDQRYSSNILLNSCHYHKIHIYRHAITQFMRTLENYVSSCSLQYSWLNFQKDLETAKNLDHLYEKHIRFMKEVLKRCFLTKESHEILNFIHILIEISLKFHYATISGRWLLVKGKYEHSKFEAVRTTFNDFCNSTNDFLKSLRKKIKSNHDLRAHEILLERFDIILT